MNLYLIVYACEPNQGGEHEVGWKIANELNKKCNLTVITRRANQKLIEQHNDKNIQFVYIENDSFLIYKPRGKFSYMYYLFWQLSVYMYLRRLVKQEDIVHYLTFGNIHLPHFLYLLKSHLILGPMGGGSVVDVNLMRTSSFKQKLKSYIYHIINWTVKINPIYYLLFFRSSKIILRTRETLGIIPKLFHYKCSVFLETGVDAFRIKQVSKKRVLNKAITTARVIDTKNVDQVIEVFQRLEEIVDRPLELTIVGGGPLKSFLQEKYASHKSITFLGKVPHDEIDVLLKEADLFLFCSIKEGGSHSLFEAAMSNCPIACYDISGMQAFPKENASIKVKPTNNIDDNIERLALKIMRYFDGEKIEEVCKNGVVDLQKNYDWPQIGSRYIKMYENIKQGL
jgi:glycosyltransferase involved in cell wall biosynthesis